MAFSCLTSKSPLSVFMLASLLFVPGCSSATRKYEAVPLAKVSGTVLEEDLPVAKAKVSFHPIESGAESSLIPSAVTDEFGKFQLTTYVKGDGAPVGNYRVTITCPILLNPNAPGLQMPVDKYKGRYSKPNRSEWEVAIELGDNHLEPFQVTSSKR